MTKKWIIKEPINSTITEDFRSSLKINATLATLLMQRGINSFDAAKDFFRPNLEELHDPFLMSGMQAAVQRLDQAIENEENILLFGDYDVDGTTAVALMYAYIGEKYGHLHYYVPDRFKEGYGLSKEGIDYAIEKKCSLIITLDCGIRNVDLIQYGVEQKIDFIVCDHHEPGETIPNAIILNPKQKDCPYPYKELCGAGVAFKFLQAWTISHKWDLENLYLNLDRVAVAIGADIVPVTGENRILAYHGLRLLNQEKRYCYKLLVDNAKRSFPLSLTDVVFTIAPRINAIGRLEHASKAVELMLASNAEEGKSLSKELEEANKFRRELDAEILEEALSILENDPFYRTSMSTVVYHPTWNKGVVGIVASRLIENHFKPTIVLTESEDGILSGSARSINTFNIYDALDKCSEHLIQFGGHQFAAGMTLKKENFEAFRTKFDEVCKSILAPSELIPIEIVDIELGLNEIFESDEARNKVPKFKRILAQMEPHGPGNMKPQFLSKNLYATDSKILGEQHLKFKVMDTESDVIVDAIAFFMADKIEYIADGVPFDLLYTMEINSWNNKQSLQLNVKDIRPTL